MKRTLFAPLPAMRLDMQDDAAPRTLLLLLGGWLCAVACTHQSDFESPVDKQSAECAQEERHAYFAALPFGPGDLSNAAIARFAGYCGLADFDARPGALIGEAGSVRASSFFPSGSPEASAFEGIVMHMAGYCSAGSRFEPSLSIQHGSLVAEDGSPIVKLNVSTSMSNDPATQLPRQIDTRARMQALIGEPEALASREQTTLSWEQQALDANLSRWVLRSIRNVIEFSRDAEESSSTASARELVTGRADLRIERQIDYGYSAPESSGGEWSLDWIQEVSSIRGPGFERRETIYVNKTLERDSGGEFVVRADRDSRYRLESYACTREVPEQH